MLILWLISGYKKSLKTTMGQSEFVNRRTDTTMTRWSRAKGQTAIYKTLHRKRKIVQHKPTKNRGWLRCSGWVSSSCSTSGTRRVTLVTNPVISYEWGKDQEVVTTSGTYPWSFVTQIFHNGQPSHGGDRKTFEVMTST